MIILSSWLLLIPYNVVFNRWCCRCWMPCLLFSSVAVEGLQHLTRSNLGWPSFFIYDMVFSDGQSKQKRFFMYFNGSEGACRALSGPFGKFSLALRSHTAPSRRDWLRFPLWCRKSKVTEESGPKWLTLKSFQTVRRDAAAHFLLTWMEGVQWTHCVGNVNPVRWNTILKNPLPFLH